MPDLDQMTPPGQTEEEITSKTTEEVKSNEVTEPLVKEEKKEEIVSKKEEKEQLDERGVPYKNKIAELERKLERERNKREQAEQYALNNQRREEPKREEQAVDNFEDANLLLTDPAKYASRLEEKITNKVRYQMEQKEALNQVLSEFPTLSEKSKEYDEEFASEVASEWKNRQNRYGRPGDLSLLNDAAAFVERKKLKTKMSTMTQDVSRSRTGIEGGTKSNSSAAKITLSDDHKSLAAGLGIPENEYAELINKR